MLPRDTRAAYWGAQCQRMGQYGETEAGRQAGRQAGRDLQTHPETPTHARREALCVCRDADTDRLGHWHTGRHANRERERERRHAHKYTQSDRDTSCRQAPIEMQRHLQTQRCTVRRGKEMQTPQCFEGHR